MTRITPQGVHVGTSMAPREDTMTAKDPTAQGAVAHLETSPRLVEAIMHQVPVAGPVGREALVLEGGADMEEITAADAVMMAINPADLPLTTIATPRAEIVTALVAVEGEGDTILVPLPRAPVATPPPRGPVDIRRLVYHREARTVADPQGNILTPQLAEVTAALTTTVEDPALVPASLDQSQPHMTVMDHRLVVVVVVVLVLVAAIVVPTAADRLIAV